MQTDPTESPEPAVLRQDPGPDSVMEADRLLALEVERQLMRLGTEDQQEAREEKA